MGDEESDFLDYKEEHATSRFANSSDSSFESQSYKCKLVFKFFWIIVKCDNIL